MRVAIPFFSSINPIFTVNSTPISDFRRLNSVQYTIPYNNADSINVFTLVKTYTSPFEKILFQGRKTPGIYSVHLY